MNASVYVLLGILVIVVVNIWDFRAKNLTPALFWCRLIAPVIGLIFFVLALYTMWQRSR